MLAEGDKVSQAGSFALTEAVSCSTSTGTLTLSIHPWVTWKHVDATYMHFHM
jgi:hypothetical protein